MKNFTKLFVAVAVLFAGFSCVTDATEDLGVKVGGQTTVTLSLEESRTQLGEKADEVYPLYWSAGDQISVNGVTSAALAEGGSASATFVLEGTLNHPYSVVYPASTESKVTFLAEQTYTPGTFCAGAAPMYGYAEDANSAVQLQHLVGVLRLAVSGEATLANIVLEAESGNLAGTYTVDCATGALTAVEGTTSKSVTLSFGEGLVLGSEATPIYIALPAGSYGMVSTKIYSTAGEVMTVKFDTTEKPIAVGKVREFKEIAYVGGEADEFGFEGDVVITTAEELALLSEACAANKLSAVTSVTIGATIDMREIEWKSMNNFPAITFDGGSDKGYEIKGLNAPLFYIATGITLKNIKLTDVDIKITEPFIYNGNAQIGSGAYAYIAISCTLSNCYASGKIEVDTKFNNAATAVSGNTNTVVDISGLIGYTSKTTMTKVTNAVDVTVKRLFDTSGDNTSAFYILVGGVTCVLYDATSVSEVYNYGDITFDFEGKDQTSTTIRCGGVFGYTPKVKTFTKVENHGDITVTGLNTTGGQYYGGLVGLPYTTPTFDTCKNSGAITVTSIAVGNFVAGSIGGTTEGNIVVKNCTVTNNSEGKGMTLSVSCDKLYAGLIGYIATSASKDITHAIENCTNSADLTLTSKTHTTSSTYVTHGFGDTQSNSTTKISITDYAVSGDITINGKIDNLLYVGGIYGYMRAKNASAYMNSFKNCSYSGDITVVGSFGNRATIGGIVGYNSANYFSFDSCHTSGSITFQNNYSAGDLAGFVGVGGLIGYEGQEVEYKSLCTSDMDISVCGNCKTAAHYLYVGGAIGLDGRNNNNRNNALNIFNSGNIVVGNENVTTTVNNLCVGGIVGKITSSATCTGFENAVNIGDITFVGTIEGVTDASYVGGIAGYTEEPIINATAHCKISAPDYNVGWITGFSRGTHTLKDSEGKDYKAEVIAKNCKIGGNVSVIEIDPEDETKKEKLTPITADNYFNYIFGGTTDWTGVENYDGCTYLETKPTI